MLYFKVVEDALAAIVMKTYVPPTLTSRFIPGEVIKRIGVGDLLTFLGAIEGDGAFWIDCVGESDVQDEVTFPIARHSWP
ncbi:hypothetical protein TSMEX_010774 [Taenia solium]|eukprot:TsM_000775200 transcript=TsM_000775200 gene=TsM_000775200